MLNWIKNLFGFKKPVEEKPQAKPVNKPATPAASKPSKKKRIHTKAFLTRLSKADLEKLARKEFNLGLDRRRTKATLVQEVLDAQEAQSKKK